MEDYAPDEFMLVMDAYAQIHQVSEKAEEVSAEDF